MASITEEWKSGTPAPGWRELMREEFRKPYMGELIAFLDQERSAGQVLHPDPPKIFRAFTLTDFDHVRVVVLGQDPYPTPGHANGLAFSVNEGVSIPGSLRNIFEEIKNDTGTPPPRTGNLERWARQGVFLLNTSLTVRSGSPNSHKGRGWENFTGRAIEALSARPEPIVFLLWGRNAQTAGERIDTGRHLVLTAAHPSPMAAHSGFFGCRHFSRANQFLHAQGFNPIEW